MTLYGEGSNASSTHKASDLHRTLEVEKFQMLKQEQHAHRWPSMWGEPMLALPIASSGERRTHSWEGTQPLRSGAQGTNRGLTNSNKGTKAAHVTLPYGIFRKKAEHSMC